MNIIGKLIIAIVILVIVYTLYHWYFSGASSSTIITGPMAAENSTMKNLGNRVGNIGSAHYSYSMWIYIKDWSYRFGEPKILFSRKDGNGRVGPQLVLGGDQNTITAMVSDTNNNITQCQVTQVPIQTWVNVIVVLNQQALDIYIDGKLTRSCVLGGVPGLDRDAGLWVCPGVGQSGQRGFDGFISSFRAFPYPLNPRQAYEIYREGHEGVSVSLFNKYRLKLGFFKGNREMGSFEI